MGWSIVCVCRWWCGATRLSEELEDLEHVLVGAVVPDAEDEVHGLGEALLAPGGVVVVASVVDGDGVVSFSKSCHDAKYGTMEASTY